MRKPFAALLTLLATAGSASAQNSFFARWEARTSATQAKQPAWTPALATTYVALIQVYRTDFSRQISSSHSTTWNYDSSRGACLIPWARTEFDINLPPFLTHSTPAATDGAGDISFLGKYRILTGNAGHGNYVVSAFVLGTIPTGSYKNGSADASLGPGMGFGKGFGRFDIQTTISATLPTGDTATLGRPVGWNTVGQYHLGKYLWPEAELNATYFHGGPNDGKQQELMTPGLIIGKIPLRADEHSRVGLGFGGGAQIATSHFHTYNHGLIFTGRLLF